MGMGCSSYKTYCGYCSTESGSNNGGLCPTGLTDSVPNISTQYFAAFPVGTFGQGKYCGMCVDVTYGGKSITATIVDECATCSSSGHIDLSLAAAVALGLGQNGATADPTSGVTWKAVDCPATGDIVGVYNNGYAGQIYFQNGRHGGWAHGDASLRILGLRHGRGSAVGHSDRHAGTRREWNHPGRERRERGDAVP
jgi:hypothetical protein